MTLVDGANHPVAKLSSEDGSPQFALYDKHHQKRAALFLEANGTPDLYLYDSSGTERAALDLFDSGSANLAFVNTETGPMVISSFPDSATYRTEIRQPGTRARGTLDFLIVNGKPQLRLLDENKNIVWRNR